MTKRLLDKNDPMGTAIADFYAENGNVSERLRVFSPMFDEDEIPLNTLFRSVNEMTDLERIALNEATGKVLDVGAGTGCHSLALQSRGILTHPIDISVLSVETMKKWGIKNATVKDFWTVTEKYDTLLMLMNGIGIVGTMKKLPLFFRHIDNILAPDGKVIFESTDISYVFTNDEGILEPPCDTAYYGELTYRMQYKNIIGPEFHWLYIDFPTIEAEAHRCGFTCSLLASNEEGTYIAEITRNA